MSDNFSNTSFPLERFVWTLPDELLGELLRAGRVYFVGGYVRDVLLGTKNSADQDILVTGISLEQLAEILSRYGKAEIVGRSFGLVKFRFRKKHYDFSVPSIRTANGNIPNPLLSIEQDLMERDFSVNSIAFDIIERCIIDPIDGIADLRRMLLRQTTPKSFEADALRILRMCRISKKLNFNIERATFQNARKHASFLENIALERIGEEFTRVIMLDKPSEAIKCLFAVGAIDIIIPELSACAGVSQPGGMHAYDVFEHILRAVDESPKESLVRFAALFHDITKPRHRVIGEDGRARFYGHQNSSAKVAMRWLEKHAFSHKFAYSVAKIIENHMFAHAATEKGIRRFIRKVGEDLIEPLFALRIADTKAQGINSNLDEEMAYHSRVREVLSQKPPLTVKALEVNGNDVMRVLNISSSPKVGEVLDKLLSFVIDDPSLNERTKLLELIKKAAMEQK